ncbi:hypothetical protein HYDPIDRAFT_77576 [Hydnomerulius pinastri MD-312]|nr:hypothetical protein HYDPIDRAFT_77576 [Hydnomerulius pinastri MD-312]
MGCLSDNLPDFSGQVIDDGRFLLISMLGSGAYGCVYRAVDTTSNPHNPDYYAVKCLSKSELTAEQLLYQTREISIHQTVSGCSPYVLTLHHIIEEELYLYFVLDLCEGGDLFTAIIKYHIYHNNDTLIRQAFLEILDGVHACHQKGIFHRDLKPENILCRKGGAGILIADFGLATRKRLCKDFGCGSSYYMSPECLSRELKYPHYSPLHTDIWSLGIILVNMVTGRNPWRLATPSDEAFLAYVHNQDHLREMLPISHALNELLKRTFNLNPSARISIPEMREAILNMESFYMTPEELRVASDNAKEAAIGYTRRAPATKLVVHQAMSDSTLVNSYDSEDYSSNGDDFPHPNWSYDSAERIMALRESAEPPPRSYAGRYVDYGDRASNFIIGSDSSSLGSDSQGPVTPEAFASDLAPEVADLAEGETLGEGLVTLDLVGKPGLKQPPVPHSMLRTAVERLIAR